MSAKKKLSLSDGFFDLCVNIPKDNPQNLFPVLSRLYELGYRTIAINQTFDETIFESEKKKRKKTEGNEDLVQSVIDPINIDDLVQKFEGKLRIYHRLTFVYSDPLKTHTLGHSTALKKYHLYSVIPKTQAALQFACSQLNADLITINNTFSGLKLNRKIYMQAVERGLCFEIQYEDILKSDTRIFAIHYSHLYHTYGKSKNVIITSGASDALMLRAPYDIINLAFTLGLNEFQAKDSILNQCKRLLLKAERRRCGKAIFSIEFSGQLIPDVNDKHQDMELSMCTKCDTQQLQCNIRIIKTVVHRYELLPYRVKVVKTLLYRMEFCLSKDLCGKSGSSSIRYFFCLEKKF